MTDAKDYLQYFRTAEARIDLKIRQLESLQDRLCSISAPMDKEQVSHTRNVDIMADTVAMIVDIQKDIDQQTSEVFRRKREAYRLLDQIDPDSASLLIAHYFNGLSVMGVGKTIHVTKRQAQRRLNTAIEEFQSVLNSQSYLHSSAFRNS